MKKRILYNTSFFSFYSLSFNHDTGAGDPAIFLRNNIRMYLTPQEEYTIHDNIGNTSAEVSVDVAFPVRGLPSDEVFSNDGDLSFGGDFMELGYF